MSQFMMKPIKVQEQSPVFNQITDDLIKAIRHLRDHHTSVLSDVPKVFFNWSFECEFEQLLYNEKFEWKIIYEFQRSYSRLVKFHNAIIRLIMV